MDHWHRDAFKLKFFLDKNSTCRTILHECYSIEHMFAASSFFCDPRVSQCLLRRKTFIRVFNDKFSYELLSLLRDMTAHILHKQIINPLLSIPDSVDQPFHIIRIYLLTLWITSNHLRIFVKRIGPCQQHVEDDACCPHVYFLSVVGVDAHAFGGCESHCAPLVWVHYERLFFGEVTWVSPWDV